MPNQLKLTAENPDELLNTGAYDAGALIQVQAGTASTQPGDFADLTGTGSTPTIAIVAGTRIYTAYDPTGTSSTWYRTRYKNAAATRVSDWSDSFQAAPEGTGLICSLYDVKQALGETGTANDEDILENIRQVTASIQHYTGRQFVRSPGSGTETWTEDVGGDGLDVLGYQRTLLYPKGLASLTTLEVATTSQPVTSGTYTTVTSTDWFLRPTATSRSYGWPATRIVISDVSGSYFARGYNTVRLTGARGWDTVPYDIQGIGQRAAVASYMTKGSGAGGMVALGPDGTTRILRHISPADMATLNSYRDVPVA